MACRAPSLFVPLLLLGVSAPAAFGAVYQCASPSGQVLLTDSPCPPGHETKFVAQDAQPVASAGASREEQPRSEPAAAADRTRLTAAEAEAAILRAQLEAERLRVELAHEQLRFIDRQLGAADDAPVIGYSVVGPVVVPGWPWRDWKAGKHGRPCVDCRPPAADFKPKIIPRDFGTGCGTFGCTPSITRAPRDDRRGPAAGNRLRLERSGAMPRRGSRSASVPRNRF